VKKQTVELGEILLKKTGLFCLDHPATGFQAFKSKKKEEN
jgi:hypothetical protein